MPEKAQTPLKWRIRRQLHSLGLWNTLEMGRLLGSYLVRTPHEDDFRFFKNFDGKPGLFLDVGANRGQSALSFRIFNKTCKIISFEPNTHLEPDLRLIRKLLGSDFEFRMHGLGSLSRDLTMFTPEVDGILLEQETATSRETITNNIYTSLRLKQLTGSNRCEVKERSFSIRTMDELGLRPTFLKIDAQGAEPDILLGAKKTIADSLPIILMENSSQLEECIKILNSASYALYALETERNSLRPIQQSTGSLNVFLAPKSRLEELKSLGALDI